MTRVFFLAILPLLAPFLVYGLAVWFARRRQAAAGPGGRPPGREATPWVVLLALGVCFSAASLLLLGADRGVPPGTKLLPPAFVDGEVVPSHPAE